MQPSNQMNAPQKGKARFDIGHLSPRNLTYKSASKSAQRRERPLMSCDALSDVMISSSDWLKIYGLSANKLSLEHILPFNGFKHSTSYDDGVKKNVSSKYGEGYFDQYMQKDGKVFNLIADTQKLQQFIQQLNAAIRVYKNRMEWLTSGSRKFFGVLHEKCVSIIINVHTYDDIRYDQYVKALEELLNDQIAKIEKFNLIKVGQDVECFKECFVDVNNSSINEALQWVKNMDRYSLNTNTCVVEGVAKAFSLAQPPNLKYGVYLFTENGATDGTREILKSRVTLIGKPLHTVAYNSTDRDTVSFLRELSGCVKGGRFHAYSVTETDVDSLTGEISYYGGTPPGAGMPDELMLIWTELENARDIVDQLEHIIKTTEKRKLSRKTESVKSSGTDSGFGSLGQSLSSLGSLTSARSEKEPKPRYADMQYMDSKTWLLQNGIRNRGLEFYTFLGGVAFRHCDGVVPNLDHSQSDKENKRAMTSVDSKKLINAKYCENFVHVLWKDGRVRHVQVTGKMFRDYETRMNSTLRQISNRISWLCQGSRELFGTVCENKVYILVDTSASMESRLLMVKEKLFQLKQEQLRHKVMFNIVAFDSHVKAWRDALVDVSEENLRQAWDWVRDIETGGSTNTLGAVKVALSDKNTEAVYLLSDGRPDQLPKSIYAQACMHPRIPIHTISFNCHDKDANEFLKELANISGGRFHIFYDSRTPADVPRGFQSEDLTLLRQELDKGKQSLKLVAKLRAECATMEWVKPEMQSDGRVERGVTTSRTPRTTREMSSGSSIGSMSHRGTPRKFKVIDPEHEMTRSLEHDSPRLDLMRKTLQTMKQYSSENASSINSARSTTQSLESEFEIPGSSKANWILEETQKMFERQKVRRDEALKLADNVLTQAQNKKLMQKTPRSVYQDETEESLRDWLKSNSLVAKRLTIIDALSKTLITQKPMFVPSIDKVVLSKVFDEILPISYATTRQKNEIHLVNPAAVDLKSYESRLTEMIQTYYRKLDFHIWQRLPYMEKQGYSNIPPNWETDRGAILESLQRCNWPVTRQELQLIDDEIELGKKFLQQSIDLRLCTRNAQNSPEIKSARHEFKSSPRSKSRRLQRAQSARRPVSDLQKQRREEISTKVELSQDEINLVNMYREKIRSNGSLRANKPQKITAEDRSPKVRRKIQPNRREEPVARSAPKFGENDSAQTSSKLSLEGSESYTASYYSNNWPKEAEIKIRQPETGQVSGARKSSAEQPFEKSTQETVTEKEDNKRELLQNIISEAGQGRQNSDYREISEETARRAPNGEKSLVSSSAFADGTGYLDEDDEENESKKSFF